MKESHLPNGGGFLFLLVVVGISHTIAANSIGNICIEVLFVQNKTRVSKNKDKKPSVLCEISCEKVLTKGEEGDILSKSLREGDAERKVQKKLFEKK